MEKYKYSDITEKIIGASFEVHTFLGNGFQEVLYQRALAWELGQKDLEYAREIEQDIFYKNLPKPIGRRRADFIVENKVLVDLTNRVVAKVADEFVERDFESSVIDVVLQSVSLHLSLTPRISYLDEFEPFLNACPQNCVRMSRNYSVAKFKLSIFLALLVLLLEPSELDEIVYAIGSGA